MVPTHEGAPDTVSETRACGVGGEQGHLFNELPRTFSQEEVEMEDRTPPVQQGPRS